MFYTVTTSRVVVFRLLTARFKLYFKMVDSFVTIDYHLLLLSNTLFSVFDRDSLMVFIVTFSLFGTCYCQITGNVHTEFMLNYKLCYVMLPAVSLKYL